MAQSPATMPTIRCNSSNIVAYNTLCIGDNPPDDCYPDKNPVNNLMWAVFLTLNIFIGLAGNLLTLLSIPYAKYRKKFGFSRSETTSLYIRNLAMWDFLFCAFAAPTYVLHIIYQGWPFGETLCAMTAIIRWGLTLADWSALSLIAISRCVLLKWPKKGKVIFSGNSAHVAIVISWLLPLGCLLLLVFEVCISMICVSMP
jgi:hypothetical protein